MKIYTIILFLLLLTMLTVKGQNVWMTRNLTNVPLDFLTHKDSIQNLLPVYNGMVFLGSDSINLKDSINDYFEVSEFYHDKISTYLLKSPHIQNGLYVTLDFVNDILFQVNLFTDESYYLSNFKLEVNRHFKHKKQDGGYTQSSDSTVNRGHVIITYGSRYSEHSSYGGNKNVEYQYYEHLEKGYGHLILIDKKILKYIPSWCGTGNGNRSWGKLQRYLAKKAKDGKGK